MARHRKVRTKPKDIASLFGKRTRCANFAELSKSSFFFQYQVMDAVWQRTKSISWRPSQQLNEPHWQWIWKIYITDNYKSTVLWFQKALYDFTRKSMGCFGISHEPFLSRYCLQFLYYIGCIVKFSLTFCFQIIAKLRCKWTRKWNKNI